MRTLAAMVMLAATLSAVPAHAGISDDDFQTTVDRVLALHEEADRLHAEAATLINAGDLATGCPRLQSSVDARKAELPLTDDLLAYATEHGTQDQERFRKFRKVEADKVDADSAILAQCASAGASAETSSGHDPAYVATYNEQSDLARQWADNARQNLEASGRAADAGDKASACTYLGRAIDAMDKRNAIYDFLAKEARRYGYDDSVMAKAYEEGRADEMGADGPYLIWYNNCPH